MPVCFDSKRHEQVVGYSKQDDLFRAMANCLRTVRRQGEGAVPCAPSPAIPCAVTNRQTNLYTVTATNNQLDTLPGAVSRMSRGRCAIY